MPLTRSLIFYDQWQSGTALGGDGGEVIEKKQENGWEKGRKGETVAH